MRAILPGLFSAEPNLLVSRLFLASAISHVLKANLLIIQSLCVRKCRIIRDWIIISQVLCEAEIASLVTKQKTHC